MVQTMYKIANDICESTSGTLPICHVPFPKKGKGSSAMAWKRNPWRLEGVKGMADMALARRDSIAHTIQTAFERDMGQSCVERNEWTDLFHIVIYSMKTMAGVLEKLEVYPDNMMREIDDSHGTYAGLAARDFLITIGFDDQEAYRIVQATAWMTLRPTPVGEQMRKGISSPDEALKLFSAICEERRRIVVPSIQEIIGGQRLEFIPTLEPTVEQIDAWNEKLRAAFAQPEVVAQWNEIFASAFARTFKKEDTLFKEILGE
jgi:argininosuccinate lyase